MAEDDTIRRYRKNLQEEVDSAHLYGVMREREAKPELAQVYLKLAESEDRHAGFWEEQLRERGAHVSARRPSWRAHVMGWLARRFGPGLVLPTVANSEQRNRRVYDDQPETQGTTMRQQERSHARLLHTIGVTHARGIEGGTLAQLEGRHRAIGGNALRAAVLGANDGLLSIFSLVMGATGAHMGSDAILVTGLAGTLAGAFSMALGEWISVQSSRELYERQIRVEAEELRLAPEEEEEELALIYEAKGVPAEEARGIAAHLISDRSSALDTLAREEIGIDPNELGGSAWVAALTSFALFVVGASAPLLPFVVLDGGVATAVSAVASGLGLFLIGAAITLLTGRSVWYSGTRQLALGFAAAAVTFGVGYVVGGALVH